MKQRHLTEIAVTALAFIVVVAASPSKTRADTSEAGSASALSRFPVQAAPPQLMAGASVASEQPEGQGNVHAPPVSAGIFFDVALISLFILVIPPGERRSALRIHSPSISGGENKMTAQ